MTDLALACTPDLGALRAAAQAVLPGLSVAVERVDAVAPSGPAPAADVWLGVVERAPETGFPCGVCVGVRLAPEHDLEDWLRDFGEALSRALEARVLVGDTRVGPTPSPYWCLVWDAGVPHLGDDSETDPAEGPPGPVRLVRRLDLPEHDRVALAARVLRGVGG
jgi:hypothetical protein